MQMSGFAVGLGFEISALQAGNQSGGGPTSNASVAISVARGIDQVAPEGVWFETTVSGFDVGAPAPANVYDPRFHKIHYKWTFSDAGTYNAPVNLISQHNDRNVAYGARVSHVFTTAATYSVTVTATDASGNQATHSTLVTVKNPATEYPTTRTMVVSTAGGETWAGEPTGADRHTTLVSAISANEALGNTGRILLKKGQTHTTTGITVVSAANNFRLGVWGSGSRPVINQTSGTKCIWMKNNQSFTGDVSFEGIKFTGGWDAVTETGTSGMVGLYHDRPVNLTVHDCEFSGFDMAVYNLPGTGTNLYMVNDTIITNWKEYGLFGDAAPSLKVGLTGNQIAQDVNAEAGAENKGPHNNHGPCRHAWTNLYCASNDFYSGNGWNSSTPGSADYQPCMRHNTTSYADVYATYERNSMEGGSTVMQMINAKQTQADAPGNVILDANIFLGAVSTYQVVNIGYGGVTARNNIMIMPNIPPLLGNFRDFVAHQVVISGGTANTGQEIDIYNNTFVGLRNDANDQGFVPTILKSGFGSTFTNATEENNVLHQPNLPVPDTTFAPLDTVALFTPRNPGFRYNDVLDTTQATPAATCLTYQPKIGSSAIDAATSGQTALDDFFKQTDRDGTPSKGASEPQSP